MHTVTVPERITHAVDRGVALLDRARPGWRDEIDLDRLSFDSNEDCVLGQLYGMWGYGCSALREIEPTFTSSSYGFSHDVHVVALQDVDDEYRMIDTEWRSRIHPELTP